MQIIRFRFIRLESKKVIQIIKILLKTVDLFLNVSEFDYPPKDLCKI